jgi:hypothetical protein
MFKEGKRTQLATTFHQKSAHLVSGRDKPNTTGATFFYCRFANLALRWLPTLPAFSEPMYLISLGGTLAPIGLPG